MRSVVDLLLPSLEEPPEGADPGLKNRGTRLTEAKLLIERERGERRKTCWRTSSGEGRQAEEMA